VVVHLVVVASLMVWGPLGHPTAVHTLDIDP
jgi:hypothetical protein